MFGLVASVFVAGVLGSLHCVGMCGPFATLATSPGRVHLPQVGKAQGSGCLRSAVGSASAYNGGRLVAYVLLGGAAGGLGLVVDASGSLVGVSRLATALAGVSLLLIGLVGLLRAAGVSTGRDVLSRGAGRVLGRIAAAVGPLPPRRRAVVLGALTSLMPCGWLWAFVVTAAGTGSPLFGAAVMAALWAGTVPALMLVGAGAHTLMHRLGRFVPWVLPALLTGVGAYTLFVRAPLPTTTTTTTTNTTPEHAPCH